MIGKYTVIEEGCVIGGNTFIGNSVTIRTGTTIGINCKIGHNTTIESDCFIGKNCSIQANCYIPKGSIIDDFVFIGPSVTGSNDKRIWYGRSEKVIPHTNKSYIIMRGVRIGAGCCILPVTIGRNAFVGAGSVVTKDVKEGVIVVGNPAKCVGEVPFGERV